MQKIKVRIVGTMVVSDNVTSTDVIQAVLSQFDSINLKGGISQFDVCDVEIDRLS